ncbi:hypothetical protein [Streptomyces sp. Tu102]|nr:hypothetical protein [Streptomyces sp. Tu102]
MVTELSYGTTGLTIGQHEFGLTHWNRDGLPEAGFLKDHMAHLLPVG